MRKGAVKIEMECKAGGGEQRKISINLDDVELNLRNLGVRRREAVTLDRAEWA